MNDIFELLKKMFEDKHLFKLEDRILCLIKLKNILKENESLIYEALFKDLKKSELESYISEISLIYSEIDYFIKNLKTIARKKQIKTPLVLLPGKTYLEYVPKGIVLIISPWNYPFQLSLMPLIASIAAGNASLVKPSEISYHSSLALEKIIHELYPWPIRIILGGKEIVEELLEKSFDHIFYTGNSTVAKSIMQKASLTLTPLTLELGGKSPVVIDESADIKIAAKRIMWGKCLNAGQTCVAPDYVLIKRSIKEKFIDEIKKYLKNSFHNVKESKDYGRIINDNHIKRLVSYLEDGEIVIGGKYLIEEKFLEPTVMINIKEQSPLINEEIFGPILPILIYDDVMEVLKFIKKRSSPLSLYIFSKDENFIKNIKESIKAGSVAINDVMTFLTIKDLPFGGIGFSGMGQYHGKFGFYNLSHLRPVYHRSFFMDLPFRYPPYKKLAKFLFGKLL